MPKRKRTRTKATTPRKQYTSLRPIRKSVRLSRKSLGTSPQISDDSETSPFKGFVIHSNESATSPFKGFIPEDIPNDDKTYIDPFDALKNDKLEFHFSRQNLKTYVNKKKLEPPKKKPFHNTENREKIVEWLNDNRNNFDRLTQTQNLDDTQTQKVPLDLASISQIDGNIEDNSQKRLTRRSPYRLRTRSLNISNPKNAHRNRSNHSLAGETASMDEYCIEDCETAPVGAHIWSVMEDEYLDNIDIEMMIKKEKKRPKKRPKKLDITIQSTQNATEPSSENQQSIVSTADKLKLLLSNLNDENIKQEIVPHLLQLQLVLETFSNKSVSDKQVQTFTSSKEEGIQTHNEENSDKETQTEDERQPIPDIVTSSQHEKDSHCMNETLDDIEFETEAFRDDIDKTIVPEVPTKVSSGIVKNESMNKFPDDDLEDMYFETVVFEKQRAPTPEVIPEDNCVEIKTSQLGAKRHSDDDITIQNKRPCGKFLEDEEASIYFVSCNDPIEKITEEKGVFSDGFDGIMVEEAEKFELNAAKNMLSGYSEDPEMIKEIYRIEKMVLEHEDSSKFVQTRNKTRDTQELMDACDLLIHNATKHRENKNTPNFSSIVPSETTKSARKNLFPQRNYTDSLFDDTPQPLEESERNITSIFEQINNEKELNDDDDEEDDDYKFEPPSRVKVLQNIIIKEVDELSTTSEDADVVEDTPTKLTRINKSTVLNVTIPPPAEFQDNLQDLDITSIESSESFTIPNKVTSTPFTCNAESEKIDLSPIQHVGNGKKILGSIELAQKAKVTPLNIIKRSQRTPISHKQQKSILSYVSLEKTKPQELPCVAWSRISSQQIMRITTMVNKKLCTASTSFTPKVTHLIVPIDDRYRVKDHTVKYISAVASGIWVLSFEWVEMCLAQNKLVQEDAFEVKDFSGVPSPREFRLMGRKKQFLKGFRFYVAQPVVSATEKQLHYIIEKLGGNVAYSAEELLDKNGDICLIITESSQSHDHDIYERWLKALKVVTVDIEWLTRSVGRSRLLSLRAFTLCSEDVENLSYPSYLLADTQSISS